MPIRAIMFDLGYTLMYAKAPDMWPAIIQRGNKALMEHFSNLGIIEENDRLIEDFNQRLHQYYSERDEHMIETSTFLVLKELLAEKGLGNVSDAIIRDSLDAHYAVTQKNWKLEKDTIPCLETLKQSKYKMGIISNAGDDRDVQQLVEQFNIQHFFELVLSSAACGYRKPHRKIFKLALDYFNIKSNETAMVGDTLDADIKGANQLDMYSIWITRRVEKPKGKLAVKPRATIKTLAELPSLLQELELDPHA